MTNIISTIEMAFGNFYYPILFVSCVIFGLIVGKSRRKLLFIPAIVMTVAVLNPVLFKIIDAADPGHVYWRAFWMIPLIPVCAALPAIAVESFRKPVVKIAAIAASIAVLVLLGSAKESTTFKKWENADKLPYNAVKVADELLLMDEEPHVVADAEISTYLRQYSGRIMSPYARSVSYGEPGPVGKEIFACLTENRMADLSVLMRNNGYQYLVVNNRDEATRAAIEEAGFEYLENVNKFGIYHLAGEKE